jgi:hypothetical protein
MSGYLVSITKAYSTLKHLFGILHRNIHKAPYSCQNKIFKQQTVRADTVLNLQNISNLFFLYKLALIETGFFQNKRFIHSQIIIPQNGGAVFLCVFFHPQILIHPFLDYTKINKWKFFHQGLFKIVNYKARPEALVMAKSALQ